MLRRILVVSAIAGLAALLPHRAMAWGAYHCGYTHVGPSGVYHAGHTSFGGAYGGYSGGHASFYGGGGGVYHAGYGYGGGYCW